MTDSGLTKSLLLLESCSVIHREVYPVAPTKDEYSLTKTEKDFLPILRSTAQWADAYTAEQGPKDRSPPRTV